MKLLLYSVNFFDFESMTSMHVDISDFNSELRFFDLELSF